jgi:hypothetical protein
LAFLRRTRSHDRRPPSTAASRRSCGLEETGWGQTIQGVRQLIIYTGSAEAVVLRRVCKRKGKRKRKRKRKRKNIPDDKADRCGAGERGMTRWDLSSSKRS